MTSWGFILLAISVFAFGSANENVQLIKRFKRQVEVEGRCTKWEEYSCNKDGSKMKCLRTISECCRGYQQIGGDCVSCQNPTCSSGIPRSPILPITTLTKCEIGKVYTDVPYRKGVLYYTDPTPCHWVIEGPVGSTIKINTKAIELPDRSINFICMWSWSCIVFACNSGYLQFNDNRRRSSIKYCGQETVPEYTSIGNRVTIMFHNPLNVKTKLELSYEIVGGRSRPRPTQPVEETTTTIRTTSTKRTTTTTTQPTTTTTQIPTTALASNNCSGGMVWLEKRTNCQYICDGNTPERFCSFRVQGNTRTPKNRIPGCECPLSRRYMKDDMICLTREECSAGQASTTYIRPTTLSTTQRPTTTPRSTTTTTRKTTTTKQTYFPFFFFTTSNTTPYPIQTTKRPRLTKSTRPSNMVKTTGRSLQTTTMLPPSRVKCGIQKYHPVLKIYGGSNTQKGTWPWGVQIIKSKYSGRLLVCGGTLICNQFVLTAAHCFLDKGYYSVNMRIYSLVIGKHSNLNQVETDSGRYETINRFTFYPHEQYTFLPKNQYDIALLKLPNKVGITDFIRPACVPSDPAVDYNSPKDYDECIAVGWGKTEKKNYMNGEQVRSRALKQVTLQLLPSQRCTHTFANYMPTHHICAIGKSRSDDTCGGDSGGPLMCKRNGRWFIDGIVSYGLNCAEGDPGVYTRVGKYNSWIANTIQKAGGDRKCFRTDTTYRSNTVF